jgi:hypothetical protein
VQPPPRGNGSHDSRKRVGRGYSLAGKSDRWRFRPSRLAQGNLRSMFFTLGLSARCRFRATSQAPASEKASWEEAMFNTAVLNLAIGLIFCFLTVSLATGAIVEAIASLLAVRAKTLRKGIGQLLNDPNFTGLAKLLYDHAAVNPRGPGTTSSTFQKTDPAYIDRQLFGQAILDVLMISPAVAKAANSPSAPLGKPTVDDLQTAVHDALSEAATAQGKPPAIPGGKAAPDEQLKQFLNGVIERSVGDPDKIKAELVAWFDNAMDRVSGWYKRWTQLIAFIFALILAAGLNIDSIGVAKALWQQPTLADKLTADKDLKADQAIKELDAAIPIGWPNTGQNWGIAFLGWLITALSTLFGAPFWFDLLQNFIRLKGTGPSPVEKVDGKGAAA